ncbi:hypothetical protein [Marinicella sp. W31]|uniref:hypothetical protein n=1 Tax=Marinicella sp. W31 TaxID=3023713 RepID=UPI003757BC42
MKNRSLINTLLLSLLMFTQASQGTTFCVSNSVELQTALTTADSNNQADHIKLRIGEYVAPVNGFVYTGFNEDHELEISGNWSTLVNDDCGIQILSNDPFDRSTLDGNGLNSALNIIPGSSGHIRVSNLVFFNGHSDDFGGGLRILPLTEYRGSIFIENNVFFDNSADQAAALYAVGGHRIIIRNNLVTGNHSDSSLGSIYIGQESSIALLEVSGVYFTNNTVIYNGASIGHDSLFAGVKIWVEGASRAFITNNLLWSNSAGDLSLQGSGYKYLFTNVFGGWTGTSPDESFGNFSEEPIFEKGNLNFKPAINSALANRGIMPPTITHNPPWFNESWNLGLLDLAGQGRVFGSRVDIGAIESDSLSDLIFSDDFE